MSDYPIKIPNIAITNEQYRKLKLYAAANKISTHETIRMLIDSLPEYSDILNNLGKKDYFPIRKKRFITLITRWKKFWGLN